MHELSVIKNAALHALDNDSEEPEDVRMVEFRSIADPLTVLEMAQEIEHRAPAEMHAELLDLLREFIKYAEKQPSEEARDLAMRAKVLL